LIVRPAKNEDHQRILDIINEVDIYYPSLTLDNFLVLEDKGIVIGCLKLEEYPGFYYLSSLAITINEQKKDFGLKLLAQALKNTTKDVYLYTVYPGLFGKLGFTETEPIAGLPSKSMYICEDCSSDRCVCMVRRAG
jgi:N-acetylglutamate synthase-like GNAT family acetyltransferase